jgi:hypothetical protein
MSWDDTCDVYGDTSWRRHAAASAGGYISKIRPDMRMRGVTLTDSKGTKYLRITAQHRLAEKLPELEPRRIYSAERVALMESIEANVAAQNELLSAHRVLSDKVHALDTVGRHEDNPVEMRKRNKIHEAAAPEHRDAKAARLEEQRLVMAKQLTKRTPFIESNWDE